jgi:hypothetical protein
MTALAKTFAKHEGKCAFVSTINRESSAALAYGAVYAETMAWEWDEETQTRGKLLYQGESSKDSLFTHNSAVERFEKHGTFEEAEE